MKLSTKQGLTLVELILVLGLSVILIGGGVMLYGSYVEQEKPEAIEFNKQIYPVAPSLAAMMEAFNFHRIFTEALEGSEFNFCLPPIWTGFNFGSLYLLKSLLDGSLRNTEEVISGTYNFKKFQESSPSSIDFTCILLNRDFQKSIFVQLRRHTQSSRNTEYNLYTAQLYSLYRKEKAAYRYAIKASEDTYGREDNVIRLFYGEPSDPASREFSNIVLFPDPFLSSESSNNLQALPRFSYVFDVF